ncbi:hypothetical protein TNCV_4604731 [Trichonephila clavipes]|nr:hypothetical protein TNCV_4604731 [Trichonephila clavipes]
MKAFRNFGEIYHMDYEISGLFEKAVEGTSRVQIEVCVEEETEHVLFSKKSRNTQRCSDQVNWNATLGVSLHHPHVTMFEHSETCEQGRFHPGTQYVFPKRVMRRVKMIFENAWIIIGCDPSPQDNEKPRSSGRYCAPRHHRIRVSRLKTGSQYKVILTVFARRTYVWRFGIM